MSNECRPPEGTPDGTICNLAHIQERPEKPPTQAVWFGGGGNAERWQWIRSWSVEQMTIMGFSFHSIAEVPMKKADAYLWRVTRPKWNWRKPFVSRRWLAEIVYVHGGTLTRHFSQHSAKADGEHFVKQWIGGAP